MEVYMYVIYGLLASWTIFSVYYIIRVWRLKDANKVIPYVYDSIPTVFTTLGVLGTFVGIYFGLRQFNVNDITGSIPTLLEGLKTAFTTSIWGISLSLIFGKLSQIILRNVELITEEPPTDELSALQEISKTLKENNSVIIETKEQTNQNLNLLNKSLVGENDDSVSTQLIKLRNQFSELEKSQEKNNITLEKVQLALGGDGETSLLTQIQKLRAEQNEYSKDNKKNIESIVQNMNSNSELIRNKFDEFTILLAKNNTEALVEVMKSATEQFNKQMSALIERLVQENFKELNNSVQQMNKWQTENKEIIQKLTEQFKSVSNDFVISSKSIKEITENTAKLTNENSSLNKLIVELQKVMIEDTKYQELIKNLTETINTLNTTSLTLNKTTEEFEGATDKLKTWISQEKRFKDSVDMLLKRLEEYEKIKSYSEEFWSGTKKQMEEGVSIIAKANSKLEKDIQSINQMFYKELNDTLNSLDNILQQYIQNGGRR